MNGSASIGGKIRNLRKQSGKTLAQLSKTTGLSISALSKIENDLVSPTVLNLMRLLEALDVQIADVLSTNEDKATPTARMAVSRADERVFQSVHDQEFCALCVNLQHKIMKPLVTKVHPKLDGPDVELISHSGEEFVYVLKGEMEIRTEYYQPVRLGEGDCMYLDSPMAHRYVTIGDTVAEALVIWLPNRHQSDGTLSDEIKALAGLSDDT